MSVLLIIVIGITAIFSFIGFQDLSFFDKYKFNVSAVLYKKEYFRLLSAVVLHADISHLLFNMITLFFFGSIASGEFGGVGFLIVYVGSILLGNIFTLYLYKNRGWYSAIGASGGVSGILFAAIAIYPQIGINFFFIPISIPGFIFGLLYFGYSVYSMLNPRTGDNIGHAAHMGGAVLGLVYAIAVEPQQVIQNALYLGIMSLPLIYLAYEVFIRKRIG